jgi:hypothetical protein
MVTTEGGGKQAEEKVEDLFKTSLVVEDISEDVLKILLDFGIPYDIKRSIHPQTLKKYCQELLDSGKKVPDGISVFQYQETKIK